MQKKSIYVETTIVSYLTARPSRDLIRAAHQENCRHLANARTAEAIAEVIRSKGYRPPVVTTPEGLLELEE